MARIIDDDKVKMQLTLAMSMHMPLNTKYVIIPIDNFVQTIIQNATIGEVVRCKDCKYCSVDRYADGNVPNYVCIDMDCGVEADGFCAWGERREND